MEQASNETTFARLVKTSVLEQADGTPHAAMMWPDDSSAIPRIMISLYRGRVRFVMNRAMRDLARTGKRHAA